MFLLELRTSNLGRNHVAHVHSHHQLILATCGTTELEIEGVGERITGSRGCLIPSDHHHEYIGDGRNRTLVLDVSATALGNVSSSDNLEHLFARPCFFSVSARLNQLAVALIAQLEQFPALHSEIALLLLRACQLQREESGDSTSPFNRRLNQRIDIEQLNEWIDRHLADEIRVEQLAELCALSTGHFYVVFRELVGVTPLVYVQRRRLEHARTLICHSDLSLGHIASLVGFRDQGSFSRAYRRHFENSPSVERRDCRF